MEQKGLNELAINYAKERGYTIVNYLGFYDNWHIYHFAKRSLLGSFTGYPRFVGITNDGHIKDVVDLDEIIFCIKQMKKSQTILSEE